MATSKSNGRGAAKTKGGAGNGKKMTQGEVLKHFAERFELKRADVKAFFEELAQLAAREVKSKDEFVLPGFGKLALARRKARVGRNPQTGEPVKIPAKTSLKFRLGKAMKDTVVPAKGKKK
ncbi:MAG TPA: HU family DNA-binding protein [Pyrinomonadaceae bacterium]|nr:HU family DNA-binding protein [Pyrinomonadaceae bacterium]